MIFVTLGTQDKAFTRLLDALEKSLAKGEITDRVIVQAGHTKFTSQYMEIHDFFGPEEFGTYMEECDLLITHGGVGSILDGLKRGKPILAAARLEKYKEHTNDHQKQIIEEFEKEGYLLTLRDMKEVGKLVKKARVFRPKKWKSNTKNLEKLVREQITTWEEKGTLAKGKKYREMLLYLVFGGLTTLVNIIGYTLLTRAFHLETYLANGIAWFLSVLFAYLTNRLFVFESDAKKAKEVARETLSFFFFRLLSLGFDMGAMYVMISLLSWNDIFAKVLSNVVVIILNYVFSKVFIFKKRG